MKTSSKPIVRILCSLSVAFAVCVYLPLETYLSAIDDLWFSIADFLPPCLLLFAVVFGICFGLASLLRGRARDVLCALMLGGTLALFVQGSFLNLDYGVMDGSAVNWSKYGSYGLWNALIWAALLLLPVVFVLIRKDKSRGALAFVGGALTAMLLVSVGTLTLTTNTDKSDKRTYFDTANEFRYSKDGNIIVFVVDQYGTLGFADMLAEDPSFTSELDGFTWFSNHVGKFPYTTTAIPYMLTGRPYLHEMDRYAYMKDAYAQEGGLLQALHRADYQVNLYTTPGYHVSSNAAADNLKSGERYPSSRLALIKKLYRLCAFRYAPHALKPSFWFDAQDFYSLQKSDDPSYVRDDANWRKRLDATGVTTGAPQKTFQFYHLVGAHIAYILDTPTTYVPSGTYVTMSHQVRNVFDTISEILRQMKAQGVYDNSTIIITGDHGDRDQDPAPVLLIKRPNDTGALRENKAFVSQDDFAATVLTAANVDASGVSGTDMYAEDEAASRQKSYVYYAENVQRDETYEYVVTSPSDGLFLYRQTGRWYSTGSVNAVAVPTVPLNAAYPMLTLEQAQQAFDFIDRFYLGETEANGGVWLCDRGVTLHCRVTGAGENGAVVRFALKAVQNGSQRVQVLDAQGNVLCETVASTGDDSLTLELPAQLFAGDEVTARLRFPDAISDVELSGWTDAYVPTQRYSLCVTSLTFLAR